MAKKVNKPVDDNVTPETKVNKPVDEQNNLVEIEIIREVAGMAIGTVKIVPASLARQVIESGDAKIKN